MIAYPNGGPTHTYEYDTYQRPVGLLEGTTQLENGVTYGPAGEVLQRVAPGQNSFRPGAQVLGTYRPTLNTYGTITGFGTTSTRRAPFLDGLKQHPGSTDSYFPYGEKKEPPIAGTDSFGTYSRREATGLDYADQRWYSSTTGRFLTADPYIASGGPGRPGSWNRYGYVEGGPGELY